MHSWRVLTLEMVHRMNNEVSGQDTGGRKYTKRTEQNKSRQTQQQAYVTREEKKEEQQQTKPTAGDLPPVAGIISSLIYIDIPRRHILWGAAGTPTSLDICVEEQKKVDELVLTRTEVISQLRSLEQPMTLFGEDDEMRSLRLKSLLKCRVRCYIEWPLSLVDCKKHDKNGFPRRDINKSKRKGADAMDDDSHTCNGRGALQVGCAEGDVSEGMASRERTNILDDTFVNLTHHHLEVDTNHEFMKNNFDALCEEDKILVFFKQLLKEWEMELHRRPESEKRTEKGRLNLATLERYVHDLDPLFTMCKRRILSPNVTKDLLIIVSDCLKRDYRMAMDQYIRLALGYATCPIGCTILDVQARERGSSNGNTGHITVNNDTTRRSLQAIKCLITLCERRYPLALESQQGAVSNGNNSHPFS